MPTIPRSTFSSRRVRLQLLQVTGASCGLSVVLPGTALAATSSFLDPQGPVAAAQRAHFFDVILLMLIVVLPVLILTPLFAWRYRRGNRRARYTPRWRFSWPLEALIWGVPVAVVVVLAIRLWDATDRLDPYAPLPSATAPLTVDVIGYDWKWLFVYPQLHIASIGRLAFPADRPLALTLTSDTVMQSFFIPALGSQIYAMAGMTTKLHLKADAPGRFLGENTQYNGEGFQKEKFQAVAMSPAAFHDWVERVKTKGVPMNAATYEAIHARGSLESLRKAVDASRMPPDALYFTDVPPALFGTVVQSFHGGPDVGSLLAASGGASAGKARDRDRRTVEAE